MKRAKSKTTETKTETKSIYRGIIWLLGKKYGVTGCDITNFRRKYNLDTTNGKPNTIIPRLLSMSKNHTKHSIKKDILTLLMTHNLRNYGGEYFC